jgi:hypothetical protein
MVNKCAPDDEATTKGFTLPFPLTFKVAIAVVEPMAIMSVEVELYKRPLPEVHPDGTIAAFNVLPDQDRPEPAEILLDGVS